MCSLHCHHALVLICNSIYENNGSFVSSLAAACVINAVSLLVQVCIHLSCTYHVMRRHPLGYAIKMVHVLLWLTVLLLLNLIQNLFRYAILLMICLTWVVMLYYRLELSVYHLWRKNCQHAKEQGTMSAFLMTRYVVENRYF